MRRALVMIVFGASTLFLSAAPAFAHCHYFTFDMASYTVSESAGSVTLAVSRDGSYADSSVKYSTADQTAKAGRDYTARSGTLAYTGTELTKQIVIPIIDDSKHEASQTFGVTLHDASGCDGSGYMYGPPATVTITDPDPKPTATPTHSVSPKPTPKVTPSKQPRTPSATPTLKPTPAQSRKATPSAIAVAGTGNGSGLSGGAIAGIVAAIFVLGGVAAFLVRRRKST